MKLMKDMKDALWSTVYVAKAFMSFMVHVMQRVWHDRCVMLLCTLADDGAAGGGAAGTPAPPIPKMEFDAVIRQADREEPDDRARGDHHHPRRNAARSSRRP